MTALLLASWVVACDGGCSSATEAPTVIRVSVSGGGTGSGLITVRTPDYSGAFDWTCTVTDGAPEGECSRDYEADTLEVLFYAEGMGSAFTGWSGDCSGTTTPCRYRTTSSAFARASFEASTSTVELTVDGHDAAVTILQGLSVGATATATLSNGQPATGATYTWSSSDPSVATVSGSTTGNATVTAVSPGTANVTATSGGVTSNAVAVTVIGPQSATGWLEGVVYDVDGATPLDSVNLSGGPVSGSQGDALRGKSGRQNPLDPGGIPTGGYRFEATNGRYAMFSVGVVGRRYLSTPGDTADVLADQTTTLDLFVAHGYGLDMLDTELGTVQSTPGATYNVIVNYRAWNRDLCPACVPALALGVDAAALAVYRFGPPGVYPGKTEQGVAIPITVPSGGGTIYAMLVTVSTALDIEPGLQQYRDRWAANLQGTTMVPIGTLVVN